ncbi:hypothetical protein L6452_00230 [Arctium lappa]|uniref:Uncharacterized protein n=1 Tax=Arctium lappa TaxID=4217 RepID=A0ACB9FE41_ARCLA|nr:hypothetical protein L6452_00230 [Arctium lappa]
MKDSLDCFYVMIITLRLRMGIVIWDVRCMIFAIRTEPIYGLPPVHESTLLDAMLWAVKLVLQRVIFETDTKVVDETTFLEDDN